MNIGIITKIGKNYGALLQAYALKTAIEGLGNNVGVIRFTPDISNRSYKVCKFKWRIRGLIANIKAICHYKNNQSSTRRFLSFRDRYFNFIGEYYTYEQIKNNPPACDIYVSGSDQVWNPMISFDPAYYLMFADSFKAKLTSYAASIGLKEIPENYQEEFKRRVSRFDFISVREPQAQKILANMGINSLVTPDPTLLLNVEMWDRIAAAPKIDEAIHIMLFCLCSGMGQ